MIMEANNRELVELERSRHILHLENEELQAEVAQLKDEKSTLLDYVEELKSCEQAITQHNLEEATRQLQTTVAKLQEELTRKAKESNALRQQLIQTEMDVQSREGSWVAKYHINEVQTQEMAERVQILEE